MAVDVQQTLGLHELSRRIRDEAKLLPGGVLKVVDFLNCRVDPVLMDTCGAALASRLSNTKPTKILTGSSCQGLLPAAACAEHLSVPLVFAHSCVPEAWGARPTYSTSLGSKTLCVLGEVLGSSDRVIIVDDIISSGKTIEALKTICKQAGSELVGVGVIIDNRTGSDATKDYSRFESLVQVDQDRDGHPSPGVFEVTPAAKELAVPPYVAADVLTNKILEEGKVLPGNLLKVYSFVNHQVDTALMDSCGRLLARVFSGFGVQKVMTAQTGGLPPAHAVACALRVPLICARETHEKDEQVISTCYSAASESFTKKKKLVLYVNKECLGKDEVVLIVDDFLATGTTGVALHQLVEQAGGQVAGMAFLVEKRFQDGRGKILRERPQMEGKIVSLACIESMSAESGIDLNCSVIGECMPLRAKRPKVMIDRVIEDARPCDESDMINASSFLNHMVDASLMEQAALLLEARFADSGATAVLTAETSGVAPALSLAKHLRIPLVCARREVSQAMQASGRIFKAGVEGSSSSSRDVLHIVEGHLQKSDVVLVIDDILGTGATVLALKDLCMEAGARVAGMGFLVEKVFKNGRDKILAQCPQLADDIVSLTRVLSVDDRGMKVFRCPEDARSSWLRTAAHLVRRMASEVEVDRSSNTFKLKSVLGFHMSMDPMLLDTCGQVLAAQFAGVTKVLTGAPIQGLAVAHAVARHLEVPMVFARHGVPLTMKGQRILNADAPAGPLNVSAEFFGENDRVLIVDDFLATGKTALALKSICEQAGSSVTGFAFLGLNCTTLVGARDSGQSGKTGRDALGSAKVVVLAEVSGGLRGAPCQVKVAEWLRRHAA
eukprot:TRINITY_DN75873_c0_g1_i1.p1 TRINITY_DN75873_c0_g1~~TRINITY_DN75873_c0_g1_i1.p1  ORF type:complete len:837 (+),score=166.01 TRINITY_DN75873_c0_g1_i1:57-2567(+)